MPDKDFTYKYVAKKTKLALNSPANPNSLKTTIPIEITKAMNLKKGDAVVWLVSEGDYGLSANIITNEQYVRMFKDLSLKQEKANRKLTKKEQHEFRKKKFKHSSL